MNSTRYKVCMLCMLCRLYISLQKLALRAEQNNMSIMILHDLQHAPR